MVCSVLFALECLASLSFLQKEMKALQFFTSVLLSSPFFHLSYAIGDEPSFSDIMLTHTERLSYSRISRQSKFTNNSDIYIDVVKLFDAPGAISSTKARLTSNDLSLCWLKNNKANGMKFDISFEPGTSVVDVFRTIADRRLEYLIITREYILISPHLIVVPPEKKHENITKTDILLNSLIRVPLMIRESDAQGWESLINARFQHVWENSGNEGTSPYKMQLKGEAKKIVGGINVVGYWVYRDLFDVIGLMSDVPWRVDGTTVIFDQSSP